MRVRDMYTNRGLERRFWGVGLGGVLVGERQGGCLGME